MSVTKLNFQGTTRTSRLIFKDWEKGLHKDILNSKKRGVTKWKINPINLTSSLLLLSNTSTLTFKCSHHPNMKKTKTKRCLYNSLQLPVQERKRKEEGRGRKNKSQCAISCDSTILVWFEKGSTF